MKTKINRPFGWRIAAILMIVFCTIDANAQFKNLERRIENKVKRRVEQRTDKEIDKALDKTEKGAEDAVKGNKGQKEKDTASIDKNNTASTSKVEDAKIETKTFTAYSKFDFVPGNKVVFYDDFVNDHIGDFPAKWNTNGTGEVVSTETGEKWFELKGNSVYIPELKQPLPENFTIEFDVKTSGIDKRISSVAYLMITIDDNNNFRNGRNLVRVSVPYNPQGKILLRNLVNGTQAISNTLPVEIGREMSEGARISVSVNKKRFRLYVDEQKVVDAPTLVPENVKYVKISAHGFDGDFKNFRFFLGNLKIAEGGTDLRSKLLTEGRFSTNGILFDVNSDKIKPESYGILKDLATVLKENPEVKVRIIGHTDSDGNEQTNLELSKRRAASVKNKLSSEFDIQAVKMETDGKGASVPIDSNNTPEGKANNRRVEFIKL